MAAKPKFIVKKSPIHGKGLFAAETLKKGQLIGRVKGRKTTENGPHVLWIDDKNGSAVGIEVSCDLKYINHSKQPNVSYYDDRTVICLKNITAHQELTHDYGKEWQ